MWGPFCEDDKDFNVIVDCTMCGKHKNVVEFVKNINGKQQVIHVCNECANWMADIINEYEKLKAEED